MRERGKDRGGEKVERETHKDVCGRVFLMALFVTVKD